MEVHHVIEDVQKAKKINTEFESEQRKASKERNGEDIEDHMIMPVYFYELVKTYNEKGKEAYSKASIKRRLAEEIKKTKKQMQGKKN